jgi:hypothetical protein
MQGDDQHTNDALRHRFALQPHLLQPLQRYLVDRYQPVAIGKRRPVGGSIALSIRARHSSVISITGIALMEILGRWKRPVLARAGKIH